MARIITLKYPGTCRTCGKRLHRGTRAMWLGRGTILCLCHDAPAGLIASCNDPYGIYTPDGRKIGSSCNCEDYPCCGH